MSSNDHTFIKSLMGEIPLLEHNRPALSQSGVILDYLAKKLINLALKMKRNVVKF
ncbi:hypothetical protein [Candidatus Spongiihabitans sp.]|uniref:hypothetical protein n=1 Tax=Candidatus Spongiihabitans sp. TaxID=3101308 RepID=UPI003C6EB96F